MTRPLRRPGLTPVRLHDRRVGNIAPFVPTSEVVADVLGAHQFQAKGHDRRATSRLAIGGGRSIEVDSRAIEKLAERLRGLESLRVEIDQVAPLEMLGPGNGSRL